MNYDLEKHSFHIMSSMDPVVHVHMRMRVVTKQRFIINFFKNIL